MRISFIALGIWTLILAPVLYFSVAYATPNLSKQETPGSERAALLTKFMDKYKFSKPYYVNEYIQAADRYNISFRLLASINVAESSGCKHYLYNNCFGYGSSSGLYHFKSIPEAIDFISSKLGTSHYYKRQPIETLAWNYGPHTKEYVEKIKSLMKEIK